jgi:hypothetical protein
LGFLEKRRVGTGYEYQIVPKVVEDLCERMQIPKRKEASDKDQEIFAEATTCPICMKLLPADHKETAIWEGKEVHSSCLLKIQEGRRNNED